MLLLLWQIYWTTHLSFRVLYQFFCDLLVDDIMHSWCNLGKPSSPWEVLKKDLGTLSRLIDVNGLVSHLSVLNFFRLGHDMFGFFVSFFDLLAYCMLPDSRAGYLFKFQQSTKFRFSRIKINNHDIIRFSLFQCYWVGLSKVLFFLTVTLIQ